jgi:nuclear pore complex protein Nup98-Nup96
VPSLFGASAPSAFGAAAPAASTFGAAQQQQSPLAAGQNLVAQFGYDTDGRGSRVTPFAPKAVKTCAANATDTWEQYRSISAMPAYQTKSHEELRLEDYQAGVKGKPGAQLFPAMHPSKVPQQGTPGPWLWLFRGDAMCMIL